MNQELIERLRALATSSYLTEEDRRTLREAADALEGGVTHPHLCGYPDYGTYEGQVILVAPDFLKEKWPTGIGIDVCLALEIQKLWQAGIQTTGHCCDHGGDMPYIGVIPEHIERMKGMGYKVQPNPSRPGDEDSFVPKTRLSALSAPAQRVEEGPLVEVLRKTLLEYHQTLVAGAAGDDCVLVDAATSEREINIIVSEIMQAISPLLIPAPAPHAGVDEPLRNAAAEILKCLDGPDYLIREAKAVETIGSGPIAALRAALGDHT